MMRKMASPMNRAQKTIMMGTIHIRGQKSEDRSQKSEIRDQISAWACRIRKQKY
jgi:hypothetical protein